jgi:murein DD-endopeptidase MepM/ murein hydrolase activator NlpD
MLTVSRRGFLRASLPLLIAHSSRAVTALGHAGSPQISWLPKDAFPGDVIRVEVVGATALEELTLQFIEQPLQFQGTEKRVWRAYAGIDLETKPGQYWIKGTVKPAEGSPLSVAREMRILPRRFPIERITVAEKYSTPKPEDQTRAEEESKRLSALWKQITPEKLWHGHFVLPIPSQRSTGFGRRRIVNNHPRSPHSGVDLKAPTGTPIEAANDGRVVLAEELFFSGNTVIIDHGLALYTFYAHCSELLVSNGHAIKKRDIVGKVGATGRVTGPHLHWACRINTARVNPVILTEAWIS